MATELLLVGERSGHADRGRRRARIDHAAGRVHGVSRWTVHETPTTTIALVHCEPSGGDCPVWQIDSSSLQAGIVLDPTTQSVSGSGSEAPGLLISLTAEGFTLTTDGVGFVPMYQSISERELVLSTSLHAMVSLGAADDSDPAAIVEYLTCLHPLSERTLLKGVAILKPGATLQWSPAVGATERYAPLIAPADTPLGQDEAIERFRSVWPEATASRASDPATAVGLSGGLDSRAILGGMLAAGLGPTAFTWGDDRATEVTVARRVAAALGVPHVVAPVGESMRLARANDTAAWLDGTQSVAEVYEAWDPEPILAIGPTLVTGTSGDVFWGSDKAGGARTISELRPRLQRRYASALAATGDVLDLDPLRVGASFDESLDASLAPFSSLDRSDVSTFWNLHHRQRRWGAGITMAMRRTGLTVVNPFFAKPFVQFAMALSPEQRWRGTLHAEIHRQVFPDTATIPRSNDGTSPAALHELYLSDRHGYGRQILDLARQRPAEAMRRSLRLGPRLVATKVARRTGWYRWADSVERKSAVFPHRQWAVTDGPYRSRLLELAESMVDDAPDVVSTTAAEALRDGLAERSRTIDPLFVGRLATLAAWERDWKARRLGRPDHPHGHGSAPTP